MRTRQNLIRLMLLLFAVGLLSACNSTTPTKETGTATAVSPTTTPESSDPSQQAADTVSRFLQSLMDDSSGTSSLDDLSEPLRADVESGNLLTTLLGIDNMYISFGVDTLDVNLDKGQAVVEAGLNYGSPIKRDFILTEEDGNWLINTIISYSMTAMSLPEDRLASAQVIIDYYQALEDKQTNDAMALLAPSASQNNEADVTAATKEIQGITVTSLDLTQATPDTEVYSATFWVLPNSQDPGDWTTGSNEGWIELTHTADGWRINQVSNEPIATAVPTAAPTSTSLPTATPAGNEAAQQAAQALAQSLGVDVTAVSIVSVEAHAWPDSCLGIQTPGMACAQHVVDGYLVTLAADGQQFAYRTDGDGSTIVADQPAPTATATATANTTPSAPCTLTANSDVPLYDRPDTSSGQFGVLSSGEQAVMGGQAPGGWLGFDPGVAQAANVGIFRLRWLAPGSDVTQSGSCDTLTQYPSISPTACYEMAMADTPIYAQPDETAATIATLPAGEYTAVIGKTAQDWYQVNLGDGSLAADHSGQTGWISPDAGNFNGQSCTNLSGVNP